MSTYATGGVDKATEWIDPAAGHRVIQLTREPGSASLYFHQNMYTANGDKMVIATPHGLSTIDLNTREVKPLVDGRVSQAVVGRKTRNVFYMRDGGVYETHVDSGATRLIVMRPELRSGSGLAVNADETLLAGSYVEGGNAPADPPPAGDRLETRWAAHLPMALYTIEIASGKVNAFYHSTDWLNHVQFSPTDPTLVMFCHEGPWHKVDRIWTIRTDGSARRLMHTRKMDMEIAGHEFFSADGRTIWYDLQTPKGKEFWLSGVNVDTGARVRYRVARDAWSVHYNASPDGNLFAGDGGGPRSVAAPGNGQWIYLFTPAKDELRAERLVDLGKHDYRLEPNVSFTPDGKWIVFRSNMSGASQVYAVEVRKAQSRTAGDDLFDRFASPPDEARIMMRWWWFGPAVTNPEIERELRAMKDAGIGGVEIQPVYPLTLDDTATGIRNLPFLSDEFLDRLRFAASKARELGLRVDLTLGSGWPYGGPGVTIDHASARLRHERVAHRAESAEAPLPYIGSGERLIAIINSPDATHFFIASRTGQQVKRAAVGAEGFVLDHYDRAALDAYLSQTGRRLLSAFASPPYAIFCDSLEVYEADWTGDFLEQFQARRGYDLKPHLQALFDDRAADAPAVRHDWGRTLKELLDERFVAPLAQWAHANGTRLRFQGYGTPPATPSTNALADLPEGEGADWKALWAGRWASSSNHIYDRPVTSSETWTWLHSPVFAATPLDIKAEADRHFLQGINQLIGHGWPYSPPQAEYPGWRFYAAAALDDRNPWWIVMPDVSRYLQRVSCLLRQGTPVADVAIYLPTSDAFAHFTPGHVNLIDTLRQRVGTDVIPAVLGAGYAFDFVDDEALEALGRIEGKTLRLGPQRYAVVIVPGVERMPLESLRTLAAFARAGGIVIATKRTPELAPGFLAKPADHQAVLDLAQRLFRDAGAAAHFVPDERTELAPALARLHRPDLSVSAGSGDIGFVHRRIDGADVYFIANTGNAPVHASAGIHSAGTSAEWWDPMTGARSGAALARTSDGSGRVALDLPPYGSTVLVVSDTARAAPAKRSVESDVVDVSTQWTVAFGQVGAGASSTAVRSWTDDERTRYFSGVATYERTIDVPDRLLRNGSQVRLDFGAARPVPPQPNARMQAWLDAPVRDAAVVFVNGRRTGSVWCPPYALDVTSALHPGSNTLRIEVANTAINAMAGHAPPNYRLLNLRYGNRFDAQDMDKVRPQPSGLLGPIRLVRYQSIN